MSTFRPDPFGEGSISQIYKKFFMPLIKYKPEEKTLDQWFDYLFHVDTRDVRMYKVRSKYTIKGLYYAAPHVKIQGIGKHRNVHQNDLLYVRTDSTTPNQIDVQLIGKRKDFVYCLDIPQYYDLMKHCYEVKQT